jgi:predicted ATP-binding protein involved in virulence
MGLFGIFDHSVQLHTEERLTILHGPNGVGKTVLLRLVHAFFEGRYDLFLDTNFQTIFFELSDGRVTTISRLVAAGEQKGAVESLEFHSAEASHVWSRDRLRDRRMISYIDDEIPFITRISEDSWLDDRTSEVYTRSTLVRKFSHVLPDRLKIDITDEPEWLSQFMTSLKVHLVETQRLLLPDSFVHPPHMRSRGPSRKAFASTVKKYSADLRSRASAALAQYAEHSQSLDRSFPQRMLNGPRAPALQTSDLKERMKQLEERRVQLKTIGLIEDDASYPFDINSLDSTTLTQQAVMTLYVEDTDSKLSVLDGLEKKVQLLLSNINRKFRPNKQLRTDRTAGLQVQDKIGLKIDLDSLSSGEQHELVLVYDLLFHVQPHSLVLIDEPELSLHVTWQKAFLSDLFAIIEAVDFDVLLATHSPFVVSDRVDLMVPLELESFDRQAISAAADLT